MQPVATKLFRIGGMLPVLPFWNPGAVAQLRVQRILAFNSDPYNVWRHNFNLISLGTDEGSLN